MILTAHQPVYLPWLGFFHKVALADKYIFFDQVQYLPRDWNSRNKIKTPQGELLLTVPVLEKGHRNKKICEIEINNQISWQRKHWKTLLIAYQKTQYFPKYASFFENVFNQEWKFLSELNFYMLEWFLKELGINTRVEKADQYDFQGVKSDLVLDMCLKLKSNIYIFGILGKDYADIEKFKKANVIPMFQNYNHPKYNQIYGDFIPYLSVVDLLFNEGPKSLDIIMQGNLSKDELLNMYQNKGV